MMKPVFANHKTQKIFSERGWISTPLLEQPQIARLWSLFDKYVSQYRTPFHTTHFSSDKQYKRQVNDAIIDNVFPKVEPLLLDCRPIFGNFMIKKAENNYFMPLHADWAYVDEENFRSIAVWIPLIDTDEINGSLGVIEGSHNIVNRIRGPRIRQSSYERDMSWVERFGKLLPMKAGSAIIYDHALLHYSPPNRSAYPRPAINLSIVPSEAEIIHYCIPEGADEIEVYRVQESDFYINYDNYQRPETNSLIKTLRADSVTWIDERMENFGRKKLSRMQKLRRFFSVT